MLSFIHSFISLIALYALKIAFKSIDDDDLFIIGLITSLSFFVVAALLLRLFVCFFAVLNIRAHSINEIKDAFKLVDINFKMHSMATKIALNECARLAVSDFIDIVVAVHLTNFRSVEMARVRAKTRDAVRLTHIRGAHCLANGECVCVYYLHVYYDDNCVSMS